MTSEPPGIVDLGYARLDTDRLARTGDPETVYGAGKSAEQIIELMTRLHESHPHRAVLATRIPGEQLARVAAALPTAETLIDEEAGCAVLGPIPVGSGRIGIVSAGTSDGSVAAEAALTVRVHGVIAERISDVGVAGLHRIMAVRDRLASFDALIVIAGMEGALPSVVGGLSGAPLIAVPTSVGYGASFGGLSALLAMLNSCAPGVVVVNIDNGYGAGVHASRIARLAARHPGG